MPDSAELIREHVDEGASFAELGRRYGLNQATVHAHFHRAANGELDALETHLRAGGIRLDIPLDPIEDFRRQLRRLQWIVTQLYEERGLMLKVRQEPSFAVVHFHLELL